MTARALSFGWLEARESRRWEIRRYVRLFARSASSMIGLAIVTAFLVVTDTKAKSLLGFESKDLTKLATVPLDPIVPGLVPGRLDVSNRGQIAVVDATSGAVQALPALVLAQVIEPAKIRWRTIEPDSVLNGGHGP